MICLGNVTVDDWGSLRRAIGSWPARAIDSRRAGSFSPALPDRLGHERGTAVRQALGTIRRDLDVKATDPIEAAQQVVAVITFYDLGKVDPPEPLLPATDSDIGVVCWVVVLPEPE